MGWQPKWQPKWQKKGWNPKKWVSKKPKRDESGGVLGEFEGIVSRKEKTQKYGFIISKALKKKGEKEDAFVNWDQLKSFKDGQAVTFTAFLTGKNQVQAKDVRMKKDASGGMLGDYKGKGVSKRNNFGFIKWAPLKKEGH